MPVLLNTFIEDHYEPSRGLSEGTEPWAPWTWVTADPELASALEAKLKQHGVIDGLCGVGVCTAEEEAIMDESWSELMGMLMNMMGQDGRTKKARASVEVDDDSRCHGCQKGSEALSAPLKRCAACGKAYYCSQDCQKKDWKKHKPTCLSNRSNTNDLSTASSSRPATSDPDAWTYYNTVAERVPEAKTLAQTLNLRLPASPSKAEGTM